MNTFLDPYFYAYNPELLAFENAWVNFMKNGQINYSIIRPEVADSWLRCRDMGIDPISSGKLPLLSQEEINHKLQENSWILKIVSPYMEALFQIVKDSGFVINYIDADGYILKSIADSDAFEICKKSNSLPGANRLESSAGTGSIALAFITRSPIQIAGAEHYMQELHRWTCSAAPVLDRRGKVICVLSVAGRYEMIHQHTLGMIGSVAKAIENEIHIQTINNRLAENNNQLQATVEMVSEGVLYLSEGKIIQLNNNMCDLIGKTASSLLGQSFHEHIRTVPDFTTFVEGDKGVCKNVKVTLLGENHSRRHSCFLDVRPVFGRETHEIGKVVTFTKTNDIKALANKITYQAKYTFDDILGESYSIQHAKEMALKAAAHNVRIVITGESGTGKEMFAQAIHNESERKESPFIAIDCGALPVELLESNLFGYEGGAFTGAKKEGKAGVFELANGGTLLLDEVENMPMEMQQKLLRALQENVVTRVGGAKQIPFDVRIIAATNTSLEKQVEEGTFREDLYYRLNVIQIEIPSLRERPEDIPLLVESFLSRNAPITKRKKFDKQALSLLVAYDWPGNVRQLINTIEYASIMAKGTVIESKDLPLNLFKTEDAQLMNQMKLPATLKSAMESYVKSVVAANGNNISKAAKVLDISRATVYKFLGGNKDG